jgi:DNA polymerase-3 subunit alpha
MLITSDFITEAKNHGVRVGPGRGSVGGSLVAYLLNIHNINPLEYGLLFERFLNVEKTAFPDIDSDFSPDGRDWVEQFVINKYGKRKVAHVSNLSTMTPKVVIKDIARSLELGGNKTSAFKIANAITDAVTDDSKTFEDAIQKSPKLAEYCKKYPELELYGKKLVGLEKVYSTHAAGIVISDIDLDTYAPLRYDKNNTVSIQFEKNRCEDFGLIKMDFLGLEHLKLIDATIKNAKILGNECPEPEDIDLNDKNVWNMISKGHTLCVFQMGSDHMRNLCKRIKPQNIEDLSLVNALGRPSATESREIYVARRDGKQNITFKYDCLEDPLKETLGICVYEEQLSKLAKCVAGWNLNKADGLRKLTKLKGKDPKLAAQLEEDFIRDACNHSKLDRDGGEYIWKKIIEPFAGYGFNKAHGIFYSFNGYHTAYYKYHYPAAFMAAVLRSEIEKTSSDENKLKIYKKEAKRLGIGILTPDINKSDEYFSVADSKTIVMGLVAVKGVGVKAVENIINTRKEHLFVSFEDFLFRTNSRLVRKDVIQALAKAGCFDCFGIARKYAFEHFSDIRTKANKIMETSAKLGKSSWDVFSEEYKYIEENYRINIFNKEKSGFVDPKEEWDKRTILISEEETLGEYISGGINDMYEGFFTNKGTISFGNIKKYADGTPVRIEAVIENITESKTKTGKNIGSIYGTCDLVDQNKDSISMKIWSEKWNKVKSKLEKGRPIRATCLVNVHKGHHMLVLNSLETVGLK